MPTLTCDLCATSSVHVDLFVTVMYGQHPKLHVYCSKACAIHALVRDLSLDVVKIGEALDRLDPERREQMQALMSLVREPTA